MFARAGRFVRQPGGYQAFVPAPLPPQDLAYDGELRRLLSHADQALGRLDVVTDVLPNPDLFVAMYVRQEAVLSSQIEGTQSTLEDILQFEAAGADNGRPEDLEEVVNYVAAMNQGLERLDTLPLSLRLIREIHQRLMQSGRGSTSTPGEFRRDQNWIGPPGCTLLDATFVPPPVPDMQEALSDLERFFHDDTLPTLIQAALIHAQFETIHPFRDGNGRIGRLLITFLLCQRRVLHQPTLYLSYFFKRHRAEYYDRLMAVRISGDWEGWTKFFLRGVIEVGADAVRRTRSILTLRENDLQRIKGRDSSNAIVLHLFDLLFVYPYLTVRFVEQRLKCSYNSASKAISLLVELGMLEQVSEGARNRVFRYTAYLELFTSAHPAELESPTEHTRTE